MGGRRGSAPVYSPVVPSSSSRTVSVPGVSGRLVDEMEKYPAQADVLFALQPAGGVQRSRTHEGVRLSRPLPVRAKGGANRQVGAGMELRLTALDLHAEESAVDPAPLDMGQVVNDPDQTEQSAVGAPVRGPVSHRRLAQDGASKEAEPVEEQLLVVLGVIDGKAVVRHLSRVRGPRRPLW
jgi:hypothetical protein